VSRDFYIIKNGDEVVVSDGMYELDDAIRVAQNAARREPGERYTVLKVVDHFETALDPDPN